MGGRCRCYASKSTELNSLPPFFHMISLIISPCNSICFSTGLLVDTNLDTSVPDTYTPPPTPIPYETYVGRPPTPSRNRESSENKSEVALQTANIESIQDTNAGSTFETKVKNLESDEKAEINAELAATKEVKDEKSDELRKPIELPALQAGADLHEPGSSAPTEFFFF